MIDLLKENHSSKETQRIHVGFFHDDLDILNNTIEQCVKTLMILIITVC